MVTTKQAVSDSFVSLKTPPGFSFKELRNLVHNRLNELNLTPHGSRKMVFKSLMLCAAWVLGYLTLLFLGTTSVTAAVASVALLIFFSLTLLLAVMHDASHQTITASRWFNLLFSWSLPVLGGSSIIWHNEHVVLHHGFTNIDGMDPDIDFGGILRIQDDNPWRFWHRWQHWYVLPIYSLMVLRWMFVGDFIKLFSRSKQIHGHRFYYLLLELVLCKSSHVLLFLLLPYYFVGSWLPVIIAYLCFMMILGESMAIIFVSAHISNVQKFLHEGDKKDADWALHQLATTANFSSKNRLLTWLIGGLNFQIEHHIFPNISHLHYSKIQGIVKSYCQKHNVPYNEFPTFWKAFGSHLRQLKRLSMRPVLAPATLANEIVASSRPLTL